MTQLRVVVGDITGLKTDAIVNAANSSLQGGGGVDGAIHRKAGPELALAGRMLGGCPTGQARLTPGFNLPAAWVIHTVGPVWQGGAAGEAETLAGCYRGALEIARAEGLRTVAFPAISTGVYGYPRDEAAQVAVEIIQAFIHAHPEAFDEIILCAFEAGNGQVLQQALDEAGE